MIALTQNVAEGDEKQWETPNYLSRHDQLFLVGLLERISLYIGEGNIDRYQHLIDLGLLAVHEYNSFNRHVLLTRRGWQIARQVKWMFLDIDPWVNLSMDVYRVTQSEYMSMVYGHR